MSAKMFLPLIAIIVAMNMAAMPPYNDVLVAVNDNSPQSLEIGEYFKNARRRDLTFKLPETDSVNSGFSITGQNVNVYFGCFCIELDHYCNI